MTPKTTIEVIQTLFQVIGIRIVATLIGVLVVHLLTKDRERARDAENRKHAKVSLAEAGIRQFRERVAEIRSRIATQDLNGWVNYFRDDAPTELMTGFNKIRGDIPAGNLPEWQKRLDAVLELTHLHDGQICDK